MPVTNFDFLGVSSGLGSEGMLGMNTSLSSINSLFDNDDDFSIPSGGHRPTHSIDHGVLRMEKNSEEFPILVRRTTDSSSSLMPLGNLQQVGAPNANSLNNSMFGLRKHRKGQQSLPMNSLRRDDNEMGFSHMRASSSIFDPPRESSNRSSVDLSAAPIGSNRNSLNMNAPPSLRATLSTNDVPTLNNPGMSNLTHAEQHLHNHNASMGRFPHRRNLSSSRIISDFSTANIAPGLVTSPTIGAAPELPSANALLTSSASLAPGTSVVAPNVPGNILNAQVPMYGGLYSVPPGNLGMANVALSPTQLQYPNQLAANAFQAARVRDSQQAVIAQRKMQNEGLYSIYSNSSSELIPASDSSRGGENNHYANLELDAVVGKIFETSKDQHGARFLQKKIDEDHVTNLAIVFNEVKDHIVELMKDPFGNYLCQRLLEYGTQEQRTILLHNCASDMVDIATNQHGTRALQRLIEHVETPEQIQVIVDSLSADVVNLIEDLNGNHVIQKCLNHLRADDAQFIFEAVGANAFKVGIHRHGCCVLQRCIDHASGAQKDRLISQVIESAYDLSQDQYGNYVIQYICK
jgi:Pumilio-family RNA binding repeat